MKKRSLVTDPHLTRAEVLELKRAHDRAIARLRRKLYDRRVEILELRDRLDVLEKLEPEVRKPKNHRETCRDCGKAYTKTGNYCKGCGLPKPPRGMT